MADHDSSLFGSWEQCKKCPKCKEVKLLTEFNRSPGKKYGRSSHCSECIRKKWRRPKDLTKLRFVVEPVQLSETLKAYLAGLIDGEGYIGMQRPNRTKGRYFDGIVKVAMCDPVLIDVQKSVGLGTLRMDKKSARNPRHRDIYVWAMSSNAIRAFLPGILPYLQFKRRQAELLLEYLALSNRIFRTDPEEVERYNKQAWKYHLAIKALNQRGRLPLLQKGGQ